MVKKAVGAIIVALFLCAILTAHADLYTQHGIILYQCHNETIIMTMDGNIWSLNNTWRHAGDNVIVRFRDLETEDVKDDEIVIVRCVTNEYKDRYSNLEIRILEP